MAKNRIEAAFAKTSDSSGSMPAAEPYDDEDDESEAAGEEASELGTLSGQAVLDAIESRDASALGRALKAAFKALKR